MSLNTDIDQPDVSPDRLGIWAFGFVAILCVVWIGAWLIEGMLENNIVWMTTSGGKFIYWTTLKLLLWVLPSIALIRLSGRRFRDVVGVERLGRAVLWGCGIGLALALVSIIDKALNQQPILPGEFSWALVNVAIIAPIVEEITFRGAVMGILIQRYRFVAANTLTALLFAVAHMPGWYFQGHLLETLTQPIGGAFTVFLVGWLFGLAVYKSDSLVGGILAHGINNFFS